MFNVVRLKHKPRYCLAKNGQWVLVDWMHHLWFNAPMRLK